MIMVKALFNVISFTVLLLISKDPAAAAAEAKIWAFSGQVGLRCKYLLTSTVINPDRYLTATSNLDQLEKAFSYSKVGEIYF
jgi:hypothetical protein